MPGRISLEKNQYYAHPQNSFWFIIGGLFGIDPNAKYEHRVHLLGKKAVSVWDVLKTCIRKGSKDSAIRESTVIVNDFESFYSRHPDIKYVFFNGSKAEQAYKKHVMPYLHKKFFGLEAFRLPSTSPAFASMSRAEKLSVWHIVKEKIE